MAGFDKIQTARDTKSNIQANLNKLAENELVIATDENKLYAKILGTLQDLSGLVLSDVTTDIESETGVPSARLTKQLNEAVTLLKTQMENKLEKGIFDGDAKKLDDSIKENAKKIEQNKSDILSINNFLPTITNEINKSPNGWFKDKKTGLIVQWGNVAEVGSSPFLVNFPIAFSSKKTYGITVTQTNGNNIIVPIVLLDTFTHTAFHIRCSRSEKDVSGKWLAIGY